MISTLTGELDGIFELAENYYGSKDNAYKILEIQFANQTHGQIYYPGIAKELIINLPIGLAQSRNDCLYLLAHEIIHCLSPEAAHNNIPPNRLEEGIATNFARQYMNHINMGNFWSSWNDDYNLAQSEVEKLLQCDDGIIKQVRKIQPSISRISSKNLISTNSAIEESLANQLCTTFNSTGGC